MIDGSIQSYPLTLNRILDHAAKWHGGAGVVTAAPGGAPTRVGYVELRSRALQVSVVLDRFGVSRGDRVATLAWNSQAHVEVWFAVMGMGATCHTLNPRLTAVQLAWMTGQSGAGVLVVSADLVTLAQEIATQSPLIKHILVIDGDIQDEAVGGARLQSLEPLLSTAHADFVWGGFEETTSAGLCFTSGSTGAPKGVSYTHRSNFLHTLRLLQADALGIRSTDVVLPVVPMFHANAWGLPFAVPAAGATLAMPGRHTDGASLAALIAAANVTIAVGVPTVWLGLCEHLEATGEVLRSLERIIVGGSAMPPSLMLRIEQGLGVKVQTSWGMTELSPVGTLGVMSDGSCNPAQSGRPSLGVDLMLADADGAPLGKQREQEGRLFVRGAAVIERYFGQDTPATDAGGWFDTGDLARIDGKGNLTITGRAKDLIKSGGEWINPSEIEAVVAALPQVALAAVIGRAHDKWGERPLLIVELREDEDISDMALFAALRGTIASWWIPDEIIRLPRIPLAATGKIDKLSLRASYSGALT